MKKLLLTSTTLFALPFVAFAQSLTPVTQFIVAIGNIVALLIPISIGVAMLVFFFGLVQYIRNAEKGNGQKIMIAGIISLFVMVSIWGIIRLIQTALLPAGSTTNTINAPHFPTN